jgi:hypothetical protein
MERAYRATLLVLYQMTLLAGIVMLPLAMAARRVGLQLPVHRAVERLGERYAKASAT